MIYIIIDALRLMNNPETGVDDNDSIGYHMFFRSRLANTSAAIIYVTLMLSSFIAESLDRKETYTHTFNCVDL